jgi:polysaccharide deacetylase 2 family uncharacterized protein YibQ
VSQNPRKHKQHRRKRQPVSIVWRFWRAPAGRVAGAIVVLTVLTAAIGLYNGYGGADHISPAALPLASLPNIEKNWQPAAPENKPLSLDPVARVPDSRAWLKNAVAVAAPDDRPMIAVVIDDVGLDRPRSQRAMALPAPVTIALMAYAGEARAQAAMARRAGHELIVHLPMEPGEGGEDPGPNALLLGLSEAEFERRLDWNLSQFAGYVGINNHMGSKLTSDPAALAPVMAALKRRGLMFLDSRTTSDTQGLAVARAFGVPAVERDVFIDHDPSPIAVRTALVHAEELAQANGFAIVIGHPRDVTLDALEEWLPDLEQRGFAVVPLTAIVRYRAAAEG